jgi:uncharacterized damage-inducible protein DinB
MSISKAFLQELEYELPNTRKVLERVPLDRSDWRPHPKSYTLGELATHVSNLITWGATILRETELDLAGMGKATVAKSSDELLSNFDRNVQEMRATLETATDTDFMEPWTLRNGSHVIFTLPRVAVYRSSVVNHLIHHRAQLTVYLRLNDVPVPPLYGPSADEM